LPNSNRADSTNRRCRCRTMMVPKAVIGVIV